MLRREKCDMTLKLRGDIDKMFKEIIALDGFSLTDFIGGEPEAMLLFGYASKIMDRSFEMLDDAYGFMEDQAKVNEKLLNELERISKHNEYQESLIRDLQKELEKKTKTSSKPADEK